MGITTLEHKEIGEVLRHFGLNGNEKSAYLALLKLGQGQLVPIAKAAGLAPSTVQAILARLAREGLVQVAKRRSRNVYEAYDPSVLKKILQSRLEEVGNVIPILKRLRQEKGASSPRIRVYFRERMTDIFQQALGAKNKTVYEIVSAADLQEILGEKFHFTRRRLEHGIRLKSLRVEAHEIKQYSRQTHIAELREAKFLPREFSFRANIFFWDDTVAIFGERDEALALTIESSSVRECFQQFFELLWSVSRPMET